MGMLYRNHGDRGDAQWRYFGRPLLVAYGIAALIGLLIGVGWTIAGLCCFGWLR